MTVYDFRTGKRMEDQAEDPREMDDLTRACELAIGVLETYLARKHRSNADMVRLTAVAATNVYAHFSGRYRLLGNLEDEECDRLDHCVALSVKMAVDQFKGILDARG